MRFCSFNGFVVLLGPVANVLLFIFFVVRFFFILEGLGSRATSPEPKTSFFCFCLLVLFICLFSVSCFLFVFLFVWGALIVIICLLCFYYFCFCLSVCFLSLLFGLMSLVLLSAC